jgi:hypothetical protein
MIAEDRRAPKLISWPFILAIAVLMHVDWHFARPHHHRLSLEWANHWIFAMLSFGAAGRYAAYRWHARGVSAPLINLAAALILAQGVEPLLEGAYYDHQFAYAVGAERWHAFLLSVAAGIPAFLIMYGLMRSRFRPPPP